MSKNLPRYLDSNEDIYEWEEFLKTIPQTELIGFIIDRMISDDKFFKLVDNKFAKDDSSRELKNIIAAFNNELNLAYRKSEVDTEYVVAITRNFMRALNEISDSELRREGYKHILKEIQNGYENCGLDLDEYSIIDDLKSLID